MEKVPWHKGIASLEKGEYEGSLCGDGSRDLVYHVLFIDDAVDKDLVEVLRDQSWYLLINNHTSRIGSTIGGNESEKRLTLKCSPEGQPGQSQLGLNYQLALNCATIKSNVQYVVISQHGVVFKKTPMGRLCQYGV